MATFKQLRRSIREILLSPAFLLIKSIIPLLPRRGLIGLAQLTGRLAWFLPFRKKQIALKNLHTVFGDSKSMHEKRVIITTAFSTFCMTMLDILWFSRNAEQRIRKYVTFETDSCREILLEDPAALFVTAHMGSWELIGQTCALYGAPVASIAKPIKNKVIDRVMVQCRETTGQTILPKDGAIRALMSYLRKNGKAGFVLDQNAEKNAGAIDVTFLGLPMTVSAAPAALSYRTGIKIIMVFCLPKPKGTYVILVRKVILPPPFDKTRDSKKTISRLTQEIVDTLSEEIRTTPEFWLWSHRYWRRRKGTVYPPGYPDY